MLQAVEDNIVPDEPSQVVIPWAADCHSSQVVMPPAVAASDIDADDPSQVVIPSVADCHSSLVVIPSAIEASSGTDFGKGVPTIDVGSMPAAGSSFTTDVHDFEATSAVSQVPSALHEQLAGPTFSETDVAIGQLREGLACGRVLLTELEGHRASTAQEDTFNLVRMMIDEVGELMDAQPPQPAAKLVACNKHLRKMMGICEGLLSTHDPG